MPQVMMLIPLEGVFHSCISYLDVMGFFFKNFKKGFVIKENLTVKNLIPLNV